MPSADSSIWFTKLIKGTPPRVPFASMKDKILGKEYDLSVVFKRNKDAHNILSFPLDKENGEIFIDLALCKKQCKSFERNFTNFVAFLFIHGLLHLKGYDHGSTMEREEKRYRKHFGI